MFTRPVIKLHKTIRAAWNKAVRRISNPPYNTYGHFHPFIIQTRHFRNKLVERFMTFCITTCMLSENLLVNLLALNAQFCTSPMAVSWWRHQMETVSALLAICAGNSPLPVNSPHKGQWRGALMFSSIYARINSWVNNREAGDLRRHPTHCDVIVML